MASGGDVRGRRDMFLIATLEMAFGLRGNIYAVIYYRDPDGAPTYSATPRQTADGRQFRAVRASEDISFEDMPPIAARGPETAVPRRVPRLGPK